jgi:hypothetical protein
MEIGYSEIGAVPTRKVLYRDFHEIGGLTYLVEISKHKQKVFVHLFKNFEMPRINISQDLPIKVAMKLLKDCNNSFVRFVDLICVKYNKIVIKGYHTWPKQVLNSP